MPNRRLESQVLNSGEPRHYSGWDFAGIPKIDRSGLAPGTEVLYRRQKAFAPRPRPRALNSILNAFRFR